MARDFGPFPSKPMYEVVNRRMQRALAAAVSATGFAKDGQGAVTAGTGAELVIAAYPDGALVDGLYVENPTTETVTLTTNSNTNPRIDRLVLRLDMAAETIAPFQIVGTPAASPSAPSLVQTATAYDMPLCQYTMPGSGSAQNPGSIVDERVFSRTSLPPIVLCSMITGWSAFASQKPAVYKDASGLVHLVGTAINNALYDPNDGTPHTAVTLPVGYRPGATVRFAIPTDAASSRLVTGDISTAGVLRITGGTGTSVPANFGHYLEAIPPFHPGYIGGVYP